MTWLAIAALVLWVALLRRLLEQERRASAAARGEAASLRQDTANAQADAFQAGFERGLNEGSAGLMRVSDIQCDCARCRGRRAWLVN